MIMFDTRNDTYSYTIDVELFFSKLQLGMLKITRLRQV